MKHAVGLLCAAVVAGLLGCGGSSGDYRVVHDVGPDIFALGSDDLETTEPAADRLVAMGADAVPALKTALGREVPAVRVGVIEVLGRIDDPAAATAIVAAAAHDGDVEVREAAIRALGAAPAEVTRPVVEAALGDPAAGIRLAAAGACAAVCSSPAALERLVTLAIEDQPLPNGIAARAAVIEIVKGGDPARAESLRAAIRARAPLAASRGDDVVTLRAALVASDVGDASGRTALEHAVRSEAPPLLRLQAVHALGSIGNEASVPVLAALDGQSGIGDYGYDALRRLAARHVAGAQGALDRWRGSRPAAALPPPPGAR